MARNVQVLICKCGAKYAACAEPHCYTYDDWLKDLKKHVKDGGTVFIMPADSFSFDKCTCQANKVDQQQVLF